MKQNTQDDWIAGAVEVLAGEAGIAKQPTTTLPHPETGRAPKGLKPASPTRALPIETASPGPQPAIGAPSQPNPGGHDESETPQPPATGTQTGRAIKKVKPETLPRALPIETASTRMKPIDTAPSQPASGGHIDAEPHLCAATGTLLARVTEEWRRRQDMLRAHQRLNLQAQAICRRYVDGDKVEAAKLWAQIRKDPGHEMRVWLQPFLLAMEPLDTSKKDIEKTLKKLAKELPVYPWAQGILGLGELTLAGIVGECGIGPGEYRSVSALWKRMGLAVINGGRQRRVTGDAALEHGYDAERRSLMWNIGGGLMKAQLRSEKDENGKKLEGSEYSLGELGKVYLERKAYLREREADKEEPWTTGHIHNDAKRYMEKRLLRQLWQEWRRANYRSEPQTAVPAAEGSPNGNN